MFKSFDFCVKDNVLASCVSLNSVEYILTSLAFHALVTAGLWLLIIDYKFVLNLHSVRARMRLRSADNKPEFVNVLFSVMIHYFSYCRGSHSGAWGPSGLAGGTPWENKNCYNENMY